MVHPMGQYILEWDISDQNSERAQWTEHLKTITKKQVYYDTETESLLIPTCLKKGGEGKVVNVDLWLIPPYVLAMLLGRDSNLVTHKRIKVLLHNEPNN